MVNLILVVVTAMWGLTFPLIENAVSLVSPGFFVAIRMLIALLSVLPLLFFYWRETTKFLLWGSLALGLLNTATYIFQSEGLLTIPSSRSAFITGINVVLVPILMPLFGLGRPDRIAMVSVLICLAGLYILTGHNLQGLSIGDLWTFGCAVTYALFVIIMQIMSARVKNHSLLCFYQILFSIPLALPFVGPMNFSAIMQGPVVMALIFCSLFATSLAIYLQARVQQYTTATNTALIFTLEPVFATIFAYYINGAAITLDTIIGGILIIFSILLREIIGFSRFVI